MIYLSSINNFALSLSLSLSLSLCSPQARHRKREWLNLTALRTRGPNDCNVLLLYSGSFEFYYDVMVDYLLTKANLFVEHFIFNFLPLTCSLYFWLIKLVSCLEVSFVRFQLKPESEVKILEIFQILKNFVEIEEYTGSYTFLPPPPMY